jgi:hypothetical protein
MIVQVYSGWGGSIGVATMRPMRSVDLSLADFQVAGGFLAAALAAIQRSGAYTTVGAVLHSLPARGANLIGVGCLAP